MSTDDLAGKDYWNNIYANQPPNTKRDWYPKSYNNLLLEHIIFSGMTKHLPASVLEVGCGNSPWLAYIAKKTGAAVAGIDYSEAGCALARSRLAAEGVPGHIYCMDLFNADTAQTGCYDFVYSLGVVEHFTNLELTIGKLLNFIKPGGILLTEVPNLNSIHGFISRIWQPNVYYKHHVIHRNQLRDVYARLGLIEIEGGYRGIFSFNMVAWGVEPRWPTLEKKVLRFIRMINANGDRILRSIGGYEKAIPFLSPMLFYIGKKPVQLELKTSPNTMIAAQDTPC